MKLLYCKRCGDIAAPYPHRWMGVRWCNCRMVRRNEHGYCDSKLIGSHAVWWENPVAGELRLYDAKGTAPERPEAFVLGVHNEFLGMPDPMKSEYIKFILRDTPETYLFKQMDSVIVRFRPGWSSDTRWVTELPEWHEGEK